MARPLLGLAALSASLALAACGGGDDETATSTTNEPVSAQALRDCLKDANVETGPAAPDAVLADYAQSAVSDGGSSFVITQPVAQVFVFPEGADLAEAKEQLKAAELTGGNRANGLQADSFENVVIVYFVAPGGEKAVIEKCVGGDAQAIPGFSTPYLAPASASPKPIQ